MDKSSSTVTSTVKSGGHRQAPGQDSDSSAAPAAPIVSQRLPDDLMAPIFSHACPAPSGITTGKTLVRYVNTIRLVCKQGMNWASSMLYLVSPERFRPYDSQISAAARRLLTAKPNENSAKEIEAALLRVVGNSVAIELSELGETLAKAFMKSKFENFAFQRLDIRFSGALPCDAENTSLLSGFLRSHADHPNRPPVTITVFEGVQRDISGLAKSLKAYGKGEMKLAITLDDQHKLEWLDDVVESQAIVSTWIISIPEWIDFEPWPSLSKALSETEGLRSVSLLLSPEADLKSIFSDISKASDLNTLVLLISANADTDLSGLHALIAGLPKLASLRLRIVGNYPLESLKQALEQTRLNHPVLKPIEYE